jgi:hypothetical protein
MGARQIGARRASMLNNLIVSLCLIGSFALRETDAAEHDVKQATTAVKADMDVIVSACKRKFDFATIDEFRTFIKQYKLVSDEQLSDAKVLSKCIKQREAILELDQLVVTERVCDSVQIDKIIDYHKRHIKSSRFNVLATQPLTYKFFAKYAIQVAYTCKKNLVENLNESSQLLRRQAESLERAKEMVFKERPDIKLNLKLIAEQPETPEMANFKQRSETETTLGEYREALTRLRRPEDILTFERAECKKSRTRRVKVAASELNMFFKPALYCLNLAQYYTGSLLSIARLANYGYTALDSELDLALADSPLVKDWIVAVQVCEPMLHMRTETIEQDKATVDTCAERVTTEENMMVFDDKLEQLDNEQLEDWLLRSEASRANNQKIMKSVMKNLATARLLKEVNEGHLKTGAILKAGFNRLRKPGASVQVDTLSLTQELSQQLSSTAKGGGSDAGTKSDEMSEQESFEALVQALGEEQEIESVHRVVDDGLDGPVSFAMTSALTSTLMLILIMMLFEWLFFVVVTLAARICHQMNFAFDNMLVFPPRVISWKDAQFAGYVKSLEKIDEDDFFDYQELTPDEQKQRDLLRKIFGRPPPLLYRE